MSRSQHHHLTKADEEMISEMFSGYDSEELNAAMEAEQDVLGTRSTSFVVQKDAAVIAKALEGMQSAIDAIPQKEAYQEALERAPRIVEMETPKERFLLACGYNYWAAADRIVNYWNERREIFGPDRYYLPMTISSQDSALTADVLEMIHSGSIALPPPDKYGRGVMLTDFDHLTDAYRMNTGNVRTKLYFYLTHILSESDLAVANGVVCLVFLTTDESKRIVRDGSVALFCESTASPAKHRASHVVACRKKSFVEQNMSTYQTFLERYSNLSIRTRFHFLETNDRILESIQQYGLNKYHLPIRLGGMADHRGWWNKRLTVEACRYLQPGDATNGVTALGTERESPSAVEQQGSVQQRPDAKKMAKFREWAKDHLQGCRVSKFQSEIKKLKSEKNMLLRRQAFSKAQLVFVEHIIRRYEQQMQLVYGCLSSVLASVPGVNRDIRNASHEQLMVLARRCFTDRLVFLGRAPISGEWLFEIKPGLSLEQQHSAMRLKHILQEQLQKLREEDMSRESSNKLEENNAKGECDNAALTVDEELELVEAQVQKLRAQKKVMQSEHVFLSSALVITRQIGASYDELRRQNLGLLAQYYTILLEPHTYRLHMDMHELADLVVNLADFVLSQYTAFNGEYIVNPFVSMVRQHDLILSTSLRSHALWVVEPILSRVHGGPFAIHHCGTDSSSLQLQQLMAASVPKNARPRDEDPGELERQEERRRLYRLERKKRLKRL